jgi:uncharacterized cupredoxin-like copper-binding protein
MLTSASWRRCAATTSVVLATLGAGCGSARQESRSASVVDVTERDFHISAPSTLASGEVDFRVHNSGPDTHEFIVMRAANAAALPLQDDGLTVNEAGLKKSLAGELDPGAPGVTRDLRVNLAPGRYVFFCDMTGHFMGGMHTEVVVQ